MAKYKFNIDLGNLLYDVSKNVEKTFEDDLKASKVDNPRVALKNYKMVGDGLKGMIVEVEVETNGNIKSESAMVNKLKNNIKTVTKNINPSVDNFKSEDIEEVQVEEKYAIESDEVDTSIVEDFMFDDYNENKENLTESESKTIFKKFII